MKKINCKHQTGVFEETVDAIHTRRVENGNPENNAFFMNSEFGNIRCYSFKYSHCGKVWTYGSPAQKKVYQNGWLSYMIQLLAEIHNFRNNSKLLFV